MKKQYWPSLYDRLLNGDAEGIGDHFVDADTLRNNVRRDLQALLNTTSLEASNNLTGYNRIKASVLNYGITDLPGRIADGILEQELRTTLATALRNFEPRIDPSTIVVEMNTDNVMTKSDSFVRINPEHGVMLTIGGKVHGIGKDDIYLRIETNLDVSKGSTEVSIT